MSGFGKVMRCTHLGIAVGSSRNLDERPDTDVIGFFNRKGNNRAFAREILNVILFYE